VKLLALNTRGKPIAGIFMFIAVNEMPISTSQEGHYLAIPNNLHVFSQKLVAHTVLAANKINKVQKFIWS
jgi:hypothetical protein